MTVTIRRAQSADADFLVELVKHEDVEPFLAAVRAKGRDEILEEIDRSEREPDAFGVFLIEMDGARAGTMGFERSNRRSRIADLGGLAVHPDFRGRKVADTAARLFQRHRVAVLVLGGERAHAVAHEARRFLREHHGADEALGARDLRERRDAIVRVRRPVDPMADRRVIAVHRGDENVGLLRDGRHGFAIPRALERNPRPAGVLRAFELPSGVRDTLLVQTAQSLSTVVPITPGGAGTEQGLLLYLFRAEAARSQVLSFSVGMHIVIVLVNLSLGLAAIALMTRSLRFSRLRTSAEAEEETAAASPQGTQSEPR